MDQTIDMKERLIELINHPVKLHLSYDNAEYPITRFPYYEEVAVRVNEFLKSVNITSDQEIMVRVSIGYSGREHLVVEIDEVEHLIHNVHGDESTSRDFLFGHITQYIWPDDTFTNSHIDDYGLWIKCKDLYHKDLLEAFKWLTDECQDPKIRYQSTPYVIKALLTTGHKVEAWFFDHHHEWEPRYRIIVHRNTSEKTWEFDVDKDMFHQISSWPGVKRI